MRTGNQDKVQLIVTMFRVLYDLNINDKVIWLYLNTDSQITLDLDTDCFYKSLEHFNCTKEQFVQLMNIDDVELNEALKKQEQLPVEISKKLGHVNVILELGIDTFGNIDDFMIWLNTPHELFNDKKPVEFSHEEMSLIEVLIH